MIKNPIIKIIFTVCLFIAAIGAINWMTTAYGTNLVEKVTGQVGDTETSNKVIYTIVGIAGCVVLIMKIIWLFMSMSK